MKFLQLTDSGTGSAIYIQAEEIAVCFDNGINAEVTLRNQQKIGIEETMEEVLKLLGAEILTLPSLLSPPAT